MACHRCCNPLLLLAGSHSLAGISFQTSDETDASGPGGSGPISISLPTDRDCSLLLSLLAGFALFKRPQVPRDGGFETRFTRGLKPAVVDFGAMNVVTMKRHMLRLMC